MKFLRIHFKSPKESKNDKETIEAEVFSTGDRFCPVKAFESCEKGFGFLHRNSAAFRLDGNGDSFSKRNFNIKLESFLSHTLGMELCQVTA